MATQFLEPGSLSKPGMVGRSVRLIFGMFCIYALWQLFTVAPYVISDPFTYLANLVLMIAFALCLINYVVNLGFSRNWRNYPLLVSLVWFGSIAVFGYLAGAEFWNRLFGISLLLWLGYFFAHLGISFLLAAILGTPGCEMRAIPELFGKIAGRQVSEHRCPVSFINKIDEWEHRTLYKKAN